MSYRRHKNSISKLDKPPVRPTVIRFFGESGTSGGPKYRSSSESEEGIKESKDNHSGPVKNVDSTGRFTSRRRNQISIVHETKEENLVPSSSWPEYRVTTIPGWDPLPELMGKEIVLMSLNKPSQSHHPNDVLNKYEMYYVSLEKVVDPSNFFMEFHLDPPDDGCTTWIESLQRFYDNQENVANYKMRTFKPLVGQMYALYEKDFKQWIRVRVHQLNYHARTAHVLYLDYLKRNENVDFDSLVELHPSYGHWPRFPINGDLKDIRPISTKSSEEEDPPHNRSWQPDAIEFFKDFVRNKRFVAYIVHKEFDMTANVPHCSNEDRFLKVSVLLFEADSDANMPLNALLVKKGYAELKEKANDFLQLYDFLYGEIDSDVEIEKNTNLSLVNPENNEGSKTTDVFPSDG